MGGCQATLEGRPAGFYCPAASPSPTLCPAGSWCAPMASAPASCGVGSYSTNVGQSSPSVCTPCSVCSVGGYEIVSCLPSRNRVCQTCSSKPTHSVYLGTTSSCPWVCDNAYGGSACDPCVAGFWCKYGVVNRCPLNSVSPSLSSSQNDCTCLPGFISDPSSVGGLNSAGPGPRAPGERDLGAAVVHAAATRSSA